MQQNFFDDKPRGEIYTPGPKAEAVKMLNFRNLKKDYAAQILKDGKSLFDQGGVQTARLLKLSGNSIRVLGKVSGQFDHTYTCELEIDRHESSTVDADCDCPSKYDCAHQAALIFFLEERLNDLIVSFSKNEEFTQTARTSDVEERQELEQTIKHAKHEAIKNKEKKLQKELLEEYISAAKVLGQNPFFLPEEERAFDKAELAIIFSDQKQIEIQLALRLPFRSKPLNILHLKDFLDAFIYSEPLYIGNKRFFFTPASFDENSLHLIKLLITILKFPDFKGGDKNLRIGFIESESFGGLLSLAYELAIKSGRPLKSLDSGEEALDNLPGLYFGDLENPLKYSAYPATVRFELEYMGSSAPKLLLKPQLKISHSQFVPIEEVHFFESEFPGMIHQNIYFRFQPTITRKHLKQLYVFRELMIPEPLFGTFVENALPELMRFGEVANREIIEQFVTLPYVKEVSAECDISYLEGEFEASLQFVYDNANVPLATTHLEAERILSFVTPNGIIARNLTEEQKIIDALFQDFIFENATSVFKAKTDKKIVEFMTDVIPRFQHRVKFNCPENLLDRFVYDDTTFILNLKEASSIDSYVVELKVNGALKGVTLEQLWECLSSRRPYVEMMSKKNKKIDIKPSKILVLNLDRLAPVVQIFDEIGIQLLDDSKEERPLWSLASIEAEAFKDLPIKFSMSDKLIAIQKQMLGTSQFDPQPIPQEIKAELRSYQVEGVNWLERLRKMHLNGILADDMGLGKTLQAIITLTQHKNEGSTKPSIVVCPTSLVFNWKEEINKFNPLLRVLAVDGNPQQRKKLHADIENHDVVITSYSLMQKDISIYKDFVFSYAILDEAQHIKNRGTRNAKSVKMLQASHRLILSGTPIENSLDELWSLFDFLMPGLLSTYDRFIEKYVRSPNTSMTGLESLKKKVSPFILRRMKSEVLSELPPISEIVYHCHLSDMQKELYRSYANSAREELAKLVKQEGFDRVQIHVLATLTRLKQICCHPAIFAKELAEPGDSAKYDMLIELIQTLMEGKHRTVIFSQYTRMLHILRQDLQKLGIPFEYLDGSSKNRLSIVKRFNEDSTIPIFLVSLKAGGSGLNLVGADTVIHYDMWWNPAVENQATDRVHRLGQKNSVSSYKLVTLDSIEEKIVELQNRKRGLVRHVVSCDEEIISKLTWEEVLELLQA